MRYRRTFDGLSPELRGALSRYIHEARLKDRGVASGKGWVSQSRGPEEYFFCLGIMPSYLEAWISERARQGKIEFLDAGMGQGVFSRALLDRYGDLLRVQGLRLTYSVSLNGIPGLRQRIGLLESRSLTSPVDLVVSARGALVYSLNSFAAIETLLNGMKPGAMAYFDDNKLLMPKAWFREFLKGCGVEVEVTRYEGGKPYAYKLKKQGEGPVDLSSFSQRYIEGLNAHAARILEKGFDRTLGGSAMGDILSSLYEEDLYCDLLHGRYDASFNEALASGSAWKDRSVEILDIRGVSFVNDAYSENTEHLLEALDRWRGRRVYWVAGGEGSSDLKKMAENNISMHGAIFFGEGRRELLEAFRKLAPGFVGQEIKDALEKAYHLSKPGDIVLFSPGLGPDKKIHGTCAFRAADVRRCLKELREMASWDRNHD